MYDISVFGMAIRITASKTFPQGFTVNEFSDDSDPYEVEEVEIAGSAMGLNGHLLTWAKPGAKTFAVNVVPGSDSDKNLSALYEANEPSLGKKLAYDSIAATIIFADGSSTDLSGGRLTKGMPFHGTASEGRKKTAKYTFIFEKSSYQRGR